MRRWAFIVASVFLVLVLVVVVYAATYWNTYTPSPFPKVVRPDVVEQCGLLYSDGPMQSLMVDDDTPYFLIDWSDDGSRIWMRLRTSSKQEPRGSLETGYLSDFSGLCAAVQQLPPKSVVFYGNDDVGPIGTALTRDDLIVLNGLLNKAGGRLVCLPEG